MNTFPSIVHLAADVVVSNLTISSTDAPEIKEENEIRVVTENRTVTFACSAEGNPLPDITWEFKPTGSMTATTWGRLKDINITKATSNNTGVYSCTATNKVGNVTRYFTLTMPGIIIIDSVQHLWKCTQWSGNNEC